jgi:hypothetical protein
MAMANSATILTVVLALIGLALLRAAAPASAQNDCGSCPPGYCCSKFGYCGTSFDYCNGNTCQSGPCTAGGAGSGGANVSGVVTDAFLSGIKSQAGSGCEGSSLSFYSRRAFLSAASSYPGFARAGSEADGKRELAAFFAHVTHETGRKCSWNWNLTSPNCRMQSFFCGVMYDCPRTYTVPLIWLDTDRQISATSARSTRTTATATRATRSGRAPRGRSTTDAARCRSRGTTTTVPPGGASASTGWGTRTWWRRTPWSRSRRRSGSG